jgi:hypothetical protein
VGELAVGDGGRRIFAVAAVILSSNTFESTRRSRDLLIKQLRLPTRESEKIKKACKLHLEWTLERRLETESGKKREFELAIGWRQKDKAETSNRKACLF